MPQTSDMTSITMEELRLIFSEERLTPYGKDSKDFQSVLNKYNENILICEAMYPALHYFEILLRNHLNATIGKLFKADWLLNVPGELHLSFNDEAKIQEIKDQFLKEKKRLPNQSDIVSRLSFGFWCALFHRRFDPLLWHKKNAIRSVFPNLSRERQTRTYVEPKILKVKRIRNRIAHHERIWSDRKDAYQVYAAYKNCIELIRAMSNGSACLLEMTDRFPQVYKKVMGENDFCR